MGRLTDLVRRATGGTLGSSRASTIARELALRVIDRAVSTGRRLGDFAEAVRPALGAAPMPEPAPAPPAEPIEVSYARPSPQPTVVGELGWTIARHVSTTSSAHAALLVDADPWTDAGHDPETLRRIRVASRRLRVLVTLFEPSLRPKLARRLRRSLRRIGRALGPMRELDVLGAALHAHLQSAPDGTQAAAIEHVLVDTARRRAEARQAARAALDEIDRARLRRDLEQAIGSVVTPFVRLRVEPKGEAWTLLRPRIEAAFDAAPLSRAEGPPPLGDAEALHAVRIEAKRLRYAYDLLAPAFDDLRVRKELKHVQRVIGDARDRQQVADLVQRHCTALQQQGRPYLATGLAPLARRLLAEAELARAPIAPALATLDRARILAATRTGLGARPLAVVPDEPPRAADAVAHQRHEP
jgi:CHAD domain-containing protein